MAIQTSSTPITPSASVTAAAVTLTTLLSSQPPKPASAIPPLLDQRRSQRQNGQHKNGAGAKRRIDSVSATPAKSKKATQQPKRITKLNKHLIREYAESVNWELVGNNTQTKTFCDKNGFEFRQVCRWANYNGPTSDPGEADNSDTTDAVVDNDEDDPALEPKRQKRTPTTTNTNLPSHSRCRSKSPILNMIKTLSATTPTTNNSIADDAKPAAVVECTPATSASSCASATTNIVTTNVVVSPLPAKPSLTHPSCEPSSTSTSSQLSSALHNPTDENQFANIEKLLDEEDPVLTKELQLIQQLEEKMTIWKRDTQTEIELLERLMVLYQTVKSLIPKAELNKAPLLSRLQLLRRSTRTESSSSSSVNLSLDEMEVFHTWWRVIVYQRVIRVLWLRQRWFGGSDNTNQQQFIDKWRAEIQELERRIPEWQRQKAEKRQRLEQRKTLLLSEFARFHDAAAVERRYNS